MGHSHRDILIEAGEGVRKPSGEPERPATEEPLTIVYMVQHLAHRPLSGRVGMKTLLLVYAAEKLECFAELTLNRGHDVVARNQVDVLEIIVRCFGSLWSCHLVGNPNKKRQIS